MEPKNDLKREDICVWECLIVLCLLGPRWSQDTEPGFSLVHSQYWVHVVAAQAVGNLWPKSICFSALTPAFLAAIYLLTKIFVVVLSGEFMWCKREEFYSGAFGATCIKKSMAGICQDFCVTEIHGSLLSYPTAVLWPVEWHKQFFWTLLASHSHRIHELNSGPLWHFNFIKK